MPTAREPLALYEVAETLRVCAHQRLLDTAAGEPARSCVTAGAVAWDDCECGQLVVSIVRDFLSNSFPAQSADIATSSRAQCGGSPLLVVEYNISILRCVPGTDDNGNPPSCEALDLAAQHATEDAWAVRHATWCCLNELRKTKDENNFTEIVDFIVLDQTFVGPQGLCGGSALRALVAINNACICD